MPQADRRPSIAVLAFGSALGAGYSPVASGTVGSAVALAAWWLIPGMDVWYVLAAASALCFALGVPVATAMENHYGSDPSEVVIDEVVGMWVSLLLLPKTLLVAVLAFLVFRAMDIFKPPPARQFDRMHGGIGIMLDDVAAAVYANIAVQIVVALL